MGFSVTIGPLVPPWHAVDLDETLSQYDPGDFAKLGPLVIGEPIPAMVKRVKDWRAAGDNVSIFTARLASPQCDDPMMKMQVIMAIQAWCQKNLGEMLEVTATKFPKFTDFWDDRARQVEPNTGKFLGVEKSGA